ncbi:tetraspanin-4-like [Oryza brachyantha]|uniref:tetraspanin-4-like n=1 Tax=Oryza brachyantha TaxID=4533 RepID=UPI001ADB1F92|nr:tetraspanin-4-like [Oryza brachyantha]
MLAIGLLFMIISISACCGQLLDEEGCFMCCCFGLFIPFLFLLVFLIFGYIAVGGMDFHRSNKIHEYNLDSYGGWLKGRVADPNYWSTTSVCLRDMDVCSGMRQLERDPQSGMFVPKLSSDERWTNKHGMSQHQMSPIESGCCKPPSSCAFTYMNDTTWAPKTGDADLGAKVVDCSRWSNDPQKLCFECDSCKAGFLDDTRKKWTKAALFPLVGLMIKVIGSCWTLAKN